MVSSILEQLNIRAAQKRAAHAHDRAAHYKAAQKVLHSRREKKVSQVNRTPLDRCASEQKNPSGS